MREIGCEPGGARPVLRVVAVVLPQRIVKEPEQNHDLRVGSLRLRDVQTERGYASPVRLAVDSIQVRGGAIPNSTHKLEELPLRQH